jgi:hypothetical protein
MPVCSICDTQVDGDPNYCPNCGSELEDESGNPKRQSTTHEGRTGADTSGLELVFFFLLLVALGGAVAVYNQMETTATRSGGFSTTRSAEVDQSADRITSEDTETQYATTSVNVRRGPGTSYEIVDELARRDNVEVLPDSNTEEWSALYSRSADSIEGYVSDQYLSTAYPGNPAGESTENNYTPTYERPEQSNWDSSVQTVEDYLEKTLHDPSSYESVEWYKLTRTEYRGDSYWAVRHKYRARNRFGGRVLKDEVFLMENKGKVVQVIPY